MYCLQFEWAIKIHVYISNDLWWALDFSPIKYQFFIHILITICHCQTQKWCFHKLYKDKEIKNKTWRLAGLCVLDFWTTADREKRLFIVVIIILINWWNVLLREFNAKSPLKHWNLNRNYRHNSSSNKRKSINSAKGYLYTHLLRARPCK